MWKHFTLEMKQQVEQIRHKAERNSSSHAFVSMFIWKEDMQLFIWLEPEGYMVRQGNRGTDHYFFPCGSDETKKMMLNSLPLGAVLHYADARDLEFLERWRPGVYEAQPARGDWEYLYSRQLQLELSGKLYGSFRRHTNRVRSLPGWSAQPIDAQTMLAVKNLELLWQEISGDRIGAADKRAVQTALENFEALELEGVIVFIHQEPVGYFFGSALDEHTFCGIAPRAIVPSYFCALRWELYHGLASQITTINLEEDMNIEGLRENKMLQRPNQLYEMWDITLSAIKEEYYETVT